MPDGGENLLVLLPPVAFGGKKFCWLIHEWKHFYNHPFVPHDLSFIGSIS